MSDCQVIQVIKTSLLRRGEGKDMSDPVRCVTQYWTLEGELLWEVDPCAMEPIRAGHWGHRVSVMPGEHALDFDSTICLLCGKSRTWLLENDNPPCTREKVR